MAGGAGGRRVGRWRGAPAPARAAPLSHAVAINARAAARAEIGGVERYAREMASRLPARRPDRYRVIRPPRSLAHRAGHGWEQFALPLQARRARLVYSPANLAPVASGRSVVVIHDAAALRHPEAYSQTYVAYQRRMLPAVARRARMVVTVSEFSRRELLELLELEPERVRVIPGGVDERFRPRLDAAAVRSRLGLERPYVLALSTASARKNLEVLEPVARELAREGVELVLGGSQRGYLRGQTPDLRRLGYVAEEDLPALYAGATAFVMPSRHEGFGLPCLEAMAAGTPVVAAAAGALPEICGGAAELVDAEDPEAFLAALRAVALDPRARHELAQAGLRRAARFGWERTAERTDALMDELLG